MQKWENNIKMDLKETGCCDMDEIHPVQDKDHWWAVVIMVMNL
jgi:hypothetical protein